MPGMKIPSLKARIALETWNTVNVLHANVALRPVLKPPAVMDYRNSKDNLFNPVTKEIRNA